MEAKRVGYCRSSPLTPEEKDILKEILVQYYNVLENKKTDAFSSNEKKKAWIKVADAFNSYANVTKHTPKQLKKAWENLKTLRKKQASALNQHRMATGSGPSVPDLPPDPLMEMATPYLLHTVEQEFDSDAIVQLSCSSSGCVPSTPVTLLASTLLLTDTPMDEDLDDSVDNPLPHSNQTAAMSVLNTEVDNESTSGSRFSLNLGDDDSHLSQSSCAGDECVSGRSGRVVRFPRSASQTSGEGTGRVRDRSLLPCTAVLSLSEKRVRETVTEQSVSTSSGTVQSSYPDIAVTQSNMEQSVTRSVPPSRRSSDTTRATATPPACASRNTRISSTLDRLLSEEQAVRQAQLSTSAEQRAELHAIEVQEAKLRVKEAELRVKEIEERMRARARLDALQALILEEQLQRSWMDRSQERSGDQSPSC